MAEIKDLMATLPDEVLMKIVHHLPSLRDKLRVESVSRRFERCLVELLNTRPTPFEIDIESKELNGCKVRTKLSKAVHALAEKATFSSIELIGPASSRQMESILSALVKSPNDCLDKVTVFEISCCPVTKWTLLQKALAKCTRLSVVQLVLDVNHRDLNNLGLALKGKSLTEISISGPVRTQPPLIQLYQSLEPNTLKMISLSLTSMPLDMDVLVTELYGGAWAAVEEIVFDWRKMDVDMVKLFSSLSQLPALRKCNINLSVTGAQNQMAAALTSLFANQTKITVSFDFIHNYGCQTVALIRQVQAVHPDLQVDFFGPGARELMLTLDKVRFQTELFLNLHAGCTDCHIFYPALITQLGVQAHTRTLGIQQNVHLASARLDRCRVDTIVAHLNLDPFKGNNYNALHAEMNEAQNLATITFEGQQVGMFPMTVDCGPCMSNGCFGCIHV